MKRFSLALLVLLSAAFVFAGQTDPGLEGDGDVVIKPPYKDAPECIRKEGVPEGTVHEFTMSSENSKFYPGIKGAYKRQVFVYVPSQYKPGTAAPLLVVHDGAGYAKRLPPILDNMIAEKRLPPIIAVMLHHGGGDGKGSERGLEYDTVSPKYAEFIEAEVLPQIEDKYNVKFTKDPEGRATMGGSSGSAVAFTMAWFRPDLYRKGVNLFRHVRKSAIADHHRLAARRLGISRAPDSAERRQADSLVDGSGRERQRLKSARRRLAQLGAREQSHGRDAEGQRLPLPLRVRRRRTARR